MGGKVRARKKRAIASKYSFILFSLDTRTKPSKIRSIEVRIIPDQNTKPLNLILNDKLKIEITEGFNPVLLRQLISSLDIT